MITIAELERFGIRKDTGRNRRRPLGYVRQTRTDRAGWHWPNAGAMPELLFDIAQPAVNPERHSPRAVSLDLAVLAAKYDAEPGKSPHRR